VGRRDVVPILPAAKGPTDLIVYLHGYDLTGQGYDMPRLREYVRTHVPGADRCAWWAPLYNSVDLPFPVAAQRLAEASQALPSYRRRFAVCHSMGGLVARQLNLMGAGFEAVVTLATPHEGTAGWVVTPPGSALSMSPTLSQDLQNINASDAALRSRVHAVGVRYRGRSLVEPRDTKEHDDDTLIQLASQLGTNLHFQNWYAVRMDFGDLVAPQAMLGFIPLELRENPHHVLVNYPEGDHPMARMSTAPLLTALVRAIRL